jgi:FMN reductase (NADPH)
MPLNPLPDLDRVFNKRFGPDWPSWALNDYILNQICRGTHRNFLDRPLNPGLLEALIAAAQSSPTSGTLQSYSVIAITDKETLAKFYATPRLKNILGDSADPLNKQALDTCAVFLIWLADLHRNDVILKDLKKQDPSIPDYLLEQFDTAEYQLKGIIDATIAAQSFVMCAESMNLGTMYCGWLRQMPIEFLEKEFNLPKKTFPLFGMCVGYPAVERSISVRIKTHTILHKEKYQDISGISDMQDYIDRYEARNAGRRLDQKKFKDVFLNRISYDKSKAWIGDALRYMGFKFK